MAPYIPKIMGLLPSSPKIITSAPQLPENKYPFSPDPQNPWGGTNGKIYNGTIGKKLRTPNAT